MLQCLTHLTLSLQLLLVSSDYDKKYDVVLLMEVVEHVENLELFM